MADLDAIEQKVKDNLNTIPELRSVYSYEPKNIGQLPAATLFFDGFGQRDSSSYTKNVDWRWTMRVYVKILDAEQAQVDIKNLIVSVRKALATDPMLGGTCIDQSITNGDIFVVTDQNNALMLAELSLMVTTQERY